MKYLLFIYCDFIFKNISFSCNIVNRSHPHCHRIATTVLYLHLFTFVISSEDLIQTWIFIIVIELYNLLLLLQPENETYHSSPSLLFSLMPLFLLMMSLISRSSFKRFNCFPHPLVFIYPVSLLQNCLCINYFPCHSHYQLHSYLYYFYPYSIVIANCFPHLSSPWSNPASILLSD